MLRLPDSEHEPKNLALIDWYKRKLEEEPVSYDKETDTWHVFRYDDVKRVLSDYEFFSSQRTRTTISVGADNDEGTSVDKINTINSDPPEHRKRRSLLSAAFTPRSLKLWEPRIQEVVDQLMEEMGDTVEEMLRYRFNISKMDRTVKQDNDILGVPLKKGDVVVAWMSAANMDERMFEDPFTLNIHRLSNKKHLTFGNGLHFCLGAPLARMEANIGIHAFMEKFSHIEPDPSFQLEENLTPSAVGQGLTRLPVIVHR